MIGITKAFWQKTRYLFLVDTCLKLLIDHNVLVDNDQYFENIAPEVWEYQIGGYRVCEKWLKDKKGRALSLDEIKIYCKIVTSLQKTIGIQKAIDEIYPEVEADIIEYVKRD